MEKVCVVGPFNAAMRAALEDAFSPDFTLAYVPSYEEYPALKEADYVVIRTLELKGASLELLERCRLIQRWGAGR